MQLLIVATYCYKVPDASRRYRHTGADSSRHTGTQKQIVAADSGIQEQIVAGMLGHRSRW